MRASIARSRGSQSRSTFLTDSQVGTAGTRALRRGRVSRSTGPRTSLSRRTIHLPKLPSVATRTRIVPLLSSRRPFFDPEKVTELLEQGGQAHRLPPRVRHALRRSMRRSEPWINRQGNRRNGTARKGGRRKTAE